VKGRKPKFTAEEAEHIRELYKKYSADHIARLYRCSPTTVLRAVDRKLPVKENK
jgi:DNA invertase Pin-like site-specific DNA recombinase